MKFEVFEESKQAEPVTYFKLESNDNGGVRLFACDKHGNGRDRGIILSIKRNGALYLNRSITSSLGLQLDGNSRICVDKFL